MNRSHWVMTALTLLGVLSSTVAHAGNGGSPGRCPTGQTFNHRTRTCAFAPAGSTLGCPTGQVNNGNGACVTPAGANCPIGQIINPTSGACMFAPAGSTAGCPNGQIANGSGGCLMTQTANCPAGQTFNPATGTCANPPAGSTAGCPAGQSLDPATGACMMTQTSPAPIQLLPTTTLQNVQQAPVQLVPAASTPMTTPALQASPPVSAMTAQALPAAPVTAISGRVSPLATAAAPAPQNIRVLDGATPIYHTLVWDRLQGVAGYNVYANNNATKGTWMLANATPLVAEAFTDTAFLQPGAQYRVTALYPDGRQSSSDFLYANPPQMQVPTGFAAVQIGAGQVRLSWQPVELAKGYRLFGSGQPAGGTFIAATQLVLSGVPAGDYNWQLTADYGGAWQGAGLPTASITLATPVTVTSGRYLVTITGLRAIWASVDDVLSRDGQGDEVYVKAFVREYDRRTGDVMMFTNRGTLTYGDINGRGTSRVQAGTQSASGGIRDGDSIPTNADPTERNGNPSDIALPLRIWEGTLTDGGEALVISPTIWEEDHSNAAFAGWAQQMNNITPTLYPRPEIQNQLTKGAFAPILFGTSAVPGLADAARAGNIATVFIDPTGLVALTGTTVFLAEKLFAGDGDRPIGLIPSGLDVVLPNQMVVLTREIIEAALAPLPPGTVAVAPPAWPRFPKPGVMMIPFRDGEHRNALSMVERPASYEMYLKVERLP
jgi:hypothetical protein